MISDERNQSENIKMITCFLLTKVPRLQEKTLERMNKHLPNFVNAKQTIDDNFVNINSKQCLQ